MTADHQDEAAPLADNPLIKQPAHGRGPGRPFQPGQSGNPAGRPRGSGSQLRLALQHIVEENLEPLLNTALQLAFDGNLQAIKLLLSQMPVEREQMEIALPKIGSMADILAANEAVFQAIAAGQLSAEGGKIIAELLALQMKAIEGIELERRIVRLESLYAQATMSKKRDR